MPFTAPNWPRLPRPIRNRRNRHRRLRAFGVQHVAEARRPPLAEIHGRAVLGLHAVHFARVPSVELLLTTQIAASGMLALKPRIVASRVVSSL